ncbi:MAG: acyl-CoA reductase [Candidatus Izemoplasmatales bacterium]
MILYQGVIYGNIEQNLLIDSLYDDCKKTLSTTKKLTPLKVIYACDKLAKKVRNKEFDQIILPLLEDLDITYPQFEQYIAMFEIEALIRKVEVELGKQYMEDVHLEDSLQRIVPLGILFHIAAGNVDLLPAYSIVEGLLAGNINILKLPTGDNGLSIKLLSELIMIEPMLKEYIYVFDVPSTEIHTLEKFAQIADGIVVWGGDLAVEGARKLAPINTKIIAWGHKLSFAYATVDVTDDDLIDLAKHICTTNQLLCSSCQGIFVDTSSREELEKIGRRFFDILKEENHLHSPVSLGMRSKNALMIYNEMLEKHASNKTIYYEEGVSVIISEDHELELSLLFRNVWIKPLKRDQIISQLKSHRNHLQTVGLLTSPTEINELSSILIDAGLIRITKAKDMSRVYVGETHDGTFALREYTRVVETIYN